MGRHERSICMDIHYKSALRFSFICNFKSIGGNYGPILWVMLYINQIQFQYTFIALNLHHLTDFKALNPCHIQSHSPLTICLIAVGGNRSAQRKPMLKSRSGPIPHIPVMVYWWNPHTYITMIYRWNSSANGRHWELSVLPKDTKWQ